MAAGRVLFAAHESDRVRASTSHQPCYRVLEFSGVRHSGVNEFAVAVVELGVLRHSTQLFAQIEILHRRAF